MYEEEGQGGLNRPQTLERGMGSLNRIVGHEVGVRELSGGPRGMRLSLLASDSLGLQVSHLTT